MKKYNWYLILLLVISFFIRIYRLNSLPLFGDEIDVGYQAYSLLKTGHDYRGYFLPFYTESLSESRAPLLIYLTIPFIKIFGLNSLAVRLPPLIFGVLSIYFLYKLVYLLSKSKSLAFLTSGILAISPWHYLYSRSAFEVTLLILLITAATYFFYHFIKNNKVSSLFISILFFGLSFYTYNTANIFVPLMVLYLLFTNWQIIKKQLKPRNFFLATIFTLLIITPMVKEVLWGKAAERISLISIFNNSQIIDNIVTKRTSFSSINPKIEKIFHNKGESAAKNFILNYINSFSPSFIFMGNQQDNPRHSVPEFGLIFLSFLPLLIVGIASFNPKETSHRLFLLWLLISPISAAFTINGGTHPTRLFLMIIPLSFFISLGVEKIKSFKSQKIILSVLSLFLTIEISFFAHEYFVHYPKDYAKYWNYGYLETFSDLNIQKQNKIFISNAYYNSLLPYLFYNQIIPTTIELDDHEKQNIYQDLSGFKINDQTYFVNNWHYDNNDIFPKLDRIAQSGDVFVLFQLKEIPGFMDLSKDPLKGYRTIRVIYNPDKSILSQIIQKQ